ncbi:hypothetical protein, partial [Acidithiobacillus sp.]|uniref:hypothetical protein n=1 Tax=Acidithiobacillus sp. TaxID=1872118 RepID=UPI003D01A1EA
MSKETVESWANKWNIKEDDPLYGAVLAVRESQAGAAQAAQAVQEIQAAMAKIPVAAEQAPRIISSIRGLSDNVENLVRATKNMQKEQESAWEHHLFHLDNIRKIIHMEEPRDRAARADAIAKEVMGRIDSNLLRNHFKQDSVRWGLVVGAVVIFVMGSLMTDWNLRAEHRVIP